MKVHDLIQGSPEWLEHRRTHKNASEAAAMLGLDPKTSRTELLHIYATGTEKEFSDYVQKRILDKGHQVEAMARPHIEALIIEELYPVTGSEGEYSASFDGLTMAEHIGFEHKQWNEELAAKVAAGIVPDTHMPQLQQQLLVSGAEKIIFTVSDGTPENMVHTEVLPDQAWFERIIAGWAQFEKDLAAYVPAEVVVKPVAETMIDLPALTIQSSGSITIKSNLDVFGEKLTKFVSDLNIKPETDQDFANAEAAVKVLERAQEALEAAEANALAQASDVDEMRRTVAAYAKTARDTRLMLEKVIKAEKENRKNTIITAAREEFSKHLHTLEAEIVPMRMNVAMPDFVSATKGLKTITSITDKSSVVLANGKIAADAQAKDIRDKLAWCKTNAEGYGFLFNDLQQIIFKPIEDFQLLVNSRIETHKKSEAEREQKIREEAERHAIEQANKKNSTLNDDEISPFSNGLTTFNSAQSSEIKRVVIVDHQDEIASFLASRHFKDESRVRAILVEFVAYQATHAMNFEKA